MKKTEIIFDLAVLASVALKAYSASSKKEAHKSEIGMQVVAIANDNCAGLGNSIRLGEIYTISGYTRDSYTFRECPSEYCPYLHEYASSNYSRKHFLLLDSKTQQLPAFLKRINQTAADCASELIAAAEAHQPAVLPDLRFRRQAYEALMSEFEDLVTGFEAVLSAQMEKKCGDDFRCLLESLSVPADERTLSLDCRQSLKAIALNMRKRVDVLYLNLFETPTSVRDRFAQPVERAKRAQRILSDVRTACRSAVYSCGLVDNICQQYVDYILARL